MKLYNIERPASPKLIFYPCYVFFFRLFRFNELKSTYLQLIFPQLNRFLHTSYPSTVHQLIRNMIAFQNFINQVPSETLLFPYRNLQILTWCASVILKHCIASAPYFSIISIGFNIVHQEIYSSNLLLLSSNKP